MCPTAVYIPGGGPPTRMCASTRCQRRPCLGEPTTPRALAESVFSLVEHHSDGAEYSMTVTHAEARLTLDEFHPAATLYDTAVARHSEEVGSIASTRSPGRALAVAMSLSPDEIMPLIDGSPGDEKDPGRRSSVGRRRRIALLPSIGRPEDARAGRTTWSPGPRTKGT